MMRCSNRMAGNRPRWDRVSSVSTLSHPLSRDLSHPKSLFSLYLGQVGQGKGTIGKETL